jgi:rhodanese-related sulfurtransferase
MNDTRTLPETPDPRAVADLLARREPVTILDVRTPGEFAGVRISGSYNVPLAELPERAADLDAAVGGPVVLVCRSGVRAGQAAQALRGAGLPQIRGVAGGLVLAGALGGLILWPPLGLLAAGVGAGLAFSAATDTCATASLLGRLPYNQAQTSDVRRGIDDLVAAPQAQPAVEVVV